MLPDSHSFLDQMIQIFWDFAGQTFSSQNSQNLRPGEMLDLKEIKG
jgi:hypothetical protein